MKHVYNVHMSNAIKKLSRPKVETVRVHFYLNMPTDLITNIQTLMDTERKNKTQIISEALELLLKKKGIK